jgi:hypothetical protein
MWLGLGMLALTSAPAWAGPPLVTDDPVPSPWQHWEIVTPLTLESASGDHVFQTPGLDMNYGGGKNLQVTLGTGFEWNRPVTGDSPRWSDLELAAKYRFLSWGREDHHTQIAIFPRIIVPGSATWNTVGWSSVDRRWPVVWLRELGPRTRLYGEVHVTMLHEPSERSPWFAGVAFERDASERWMLTGEAYGQEAESRALSDVRGFNVGFVRKLLGSKSDADSGIDLLFAGGWATDTDLALYVGPRFMFRRLGR